MHRCCALASHDRFSLQLHADQSRKSGFASSKHCDQTRDKLHSQSESSTKQLYDRFDLQPTSLFRRSSLTKLEPSNTHHMIWIQLLWIHRILMTYAHATAQLRGITDYPFDRTPSFLSKLPPRSSDNVTFGMLFVLPCSTSGFCKAPLLWQPSLIVQFSPGQNQSWKERPIQICQLSQLTPSYPTNNMESRLSEWKAGSFRSKPHIGAMFFRDVDNQKMCARKMRFS